MTTKYLSAWRCPTTQDVIWQDHKTAAYAVEELGEAILDETANRYIGTVVMEVNIDGLVCTGPVDLWPDAQAYAADAGMGRRAA